MEGTAPETLLVDTSYLGIVRAATRKPYLTAGWDQAVVARIQAAVLAISIITVAEEGAGEIKAGWGPRAVAEAATKRRAFLWLPLDSGVLGRWAILDADCKSRGIRGCDDNDLWIVATAIERDLVLVTCDKNQARVPTPRATIYLPLGSP